MTDTPNWRDPDLTIEERARLFATAIRLNEEWPTNANFSRFGELCAAKAQAHANALAASLETATEIIHAEREKLKQANALAADRLELLRYVVPTLSWCETDAEGFCTVHFDIVAGVLKRHAIPCPVQQIRDHVKNAEAKNE